MYDYSWESFDPYFKARYDQACAQSRCEAQNAESL